MEKGPRNRLGGLITATTTVTPFIDGGPNKIYILSTDPILSIYD